LASQKSGARYLAQRFGGERAGRAKRLRLAGFVGWRSVRGGLVRSALPLFARRGVTGVLGKVDDSLGTLRLRKPTGELVRAAAARARMPVLEFVREYLELGFHGREEIERRTTLRLDVIERVLPKRNEKGSTE
jgi:hypothetical protein